MTKFLLMICAAALLGGCIDDYSEGFRAGVVQKASYKGIFNKSYEGELVLDGFKMRSVDGNASMSNVWKFSAHDPAVIAKLDAAAESGVRVKLRYKQALFVNPMTQSTSYTIVTVENL